MLLERVIRHRLVVTDNITTEVTFTYKVLSVTPGGESPLTAEVTFTHKVLFVTPVCESPLTAQVTFYKNVCKVVRRF